MSVDTERYYVRFKGRVLGPIDQIKTLDLIRRGQITRQHELSIDGNNWRAASEYPNLFGDQLSGAASEAVVAQPQTKSTPKNGDQWYANIDGENKGPVAEEIIKGWISENSVRHDTLVWKTGMADWQEAKAVRPDWFGRKGSDVSANTAANDSEESIDGIKSFTARLLLAHGWIQFLSIAGLVIGVLALLGSIASFFGVVARDGSGSAKVTAVVFSICLVVGALAWFVASLLLLKYANRLSVLRYRSTASDLIAVSDAANRFWKFTGIAVLIWLIVMALVLVAIYFLGLSVPFSSVAPEPIAKQ